ncbi:hypothetical protein [Parapedobacter sp. SGR-10]|nr:hypothetical protein [Parapedobacter sp. SGR-10]
MAEKMLVVGFEQKVYVGANHDLSLIWAKDVSPTCIGDILGSFLS